MADVADMLFRRAEGPFKVKVVDLVIPLFVPAFEFEARCGGTGLLCGGRRHIKRAAGRRQVCCIQRRDGADADKVLRQFNGDVGGVRLPGHC